MVLLPAAAKFLGSFLCFEPFLRKYCKVCFTLIICSLKDWTLWIIAYDNRYTVQIHLLDYKQSSQQLITGIYGDNVLALVQSNINQSS